MTTSSQPGSRCAATSAGRRYLSAPRSTADGARGGAAQSRLEPTKRPPAPSRTGGRLCLAPLRARLLPHLVRLDEVADLDVVVVAQSQTTLEALADLGG